jgi:hypothetical protein
MGISRATLEKTSDPERDHENGAAHDKADDAKDQTCKGDAAATERARAGCDPPAGDEPHDRRDGTYHKSGPYEND